MRIDVGTEGFEATPQLRTVVGSRLLSALGPFVDHIESVGVRLQTGTFHSRPDTTICDVAVSLRPSGAVRAWGEDVTMSGAITRASADIRDAVEREVSRLQAAPAAHRAASVGADALEIVLDDNRISQLQREWLERPENYLRPVRVREYWRPPGVEDGALPQELELAPRRADPGAAAQAVRQTVQRRRWKHA
jgi:ribosome-associated translation inhibitor RaiA